MPISHLTRSFRTAWALVPRRPRTIEDVFSVMENNTGKFIVFCGLLGLAWVSFCIWAIWSVVTALVTLATTYAAGAGG